MKKSFLIAPLALTVLAAACGGGGGASESTTTAAAPAPKAPPVDAATAGTISGKVAFEGEPPAGETIQMAADPNCARLHSEPVKTEFVVVGEGGGLANVFVHIKSGLQGRNFPPPSEPVVLDQHGCTYVPHVIGIQVGQTLQILNSDETLHNIHAMPKNNKEFNIGQPVKGLKTDKVFDNVEVMIPFKCDVHKWMNSYAGVVDHPYYAVSSQDGSFSLANVPPGDYVVEAWHERFGTKEMNVTVTEKGTAEANFSFTAE
ncbi:MAG TPA: carboxypeptidase regulatory-like domain-containing protein [Vicinamibacteria bacterium]|nr:carboxypeptidase regulatory-like domain-containing protein [Vicinamibacteria bacterium]